MEILGRILNSPSSKRYRDLLGIKRDFIRAMVALDASKVEKDQDIKLSLVSSAYLAYRRCFKHGIRDFIKNVNWDDLPKGSKSVHDDIMSFADKYVAHSVNPLESNHVIVVRHPITGFTLVRPFLGQPNLDEATIDSFKFLVQNLLETYLKELIRDAFEEVRNEASSLTEKEFGQLDEFITVPSGKDINTARSR